ncbi:hypothetical protein [Bittarella massiliensis (ex Durand et al. 2017)]|uniref:hypothetical protein n=1 Tax=Bittarella massiliensis (ex Durand et al. 2017) TaxID=1720313 RepID=UPI00073F320B|nr:hypothetical protein [Bittarella massiliensis (ex Durand et al. 2017)]
MKAFWKNRKKLLLSLLTAALVFGIGSTLAYEVSGTGAVTNRFSPADMSTDIEEDDSLGNKTVSIVNTGKSPAYVRARIMVSGVAESDLLFVPKGSSMKDESKVYIEVNRTDWSRASGDTSKSGFFYYCAPLPAGSATPPLMYSVKIGKDLYGGEGQPKTLSDFLEQTGFSVTIYQESVLAEPGGLTSLPAIAALF